MTQSVVSLGVNRIGTDQRERVDGPQRIPDAVFLLSNLLARH